MAGCSRNKYSEQCESAQYWEVQNLEEEIRQIKEIKVAEIEFLHRVELDFFMPTLFYHTAKPISKDYSFI
ncbi:hypothetical protein E8E12_007558 [Didymella heteroderae]|uniref:Uncharacterized protein n=1 Tax=Didymella heteroderae TaxID=1769908 RepID=A0A9P4WMD2_9PLEO|nr:hypothetical protein E8E12_007558 [Didymella heteroderae]